MPNTRTLTRSFSGGEISPDMLGRIDDNRYQSGAAKLLNFIATPQGPAQNRPGFAYVNSTKNNGVARLIPFTYSSEQTMVVEMGAGYFRFHTQGETLEYAPAAIGPWVPPSGIISVYYSTPAILTWGSHGLSDGDPFVFFLYGATTPDDLPNGLKVGYVYTAKVIDSDSVYILDQGQTISLTPSGGGTTTNYAGSGTASVTAFAAPYESDVADSGVLSGLPSAVSSSGYATLNVTLSASAIRGPASSVVVDFKYSTDGVNWATFYSTRSTVSTTVSVNIPVANLNLLQLMVEASATSASDKNSARASGAISAWSVDVTTSGGGPIVFTGVRVYRQYTSGDIVSHGGSSYSASQTGPGGLITPGTDESVWHLLPALAIYEVKNSYAEADLFDIHYVQSADVITLTHRNYPPSELRRLGATSWSFTPIAFGQALTPPQGVTAAASPGYLAKITASDGLTPSKLTTQASHTLALGDGVYVSGLTIGGVVTNGFYLVSKVPVDGSGNLIPNQLYLMDYSGNDVTATVSGTPTIQYGGKIIDITNYYVVTALSSDSINESQISDEVSVLDNLNVTGSFNTISWQAVTNAARYRVYKKKNGLYAYIGETPALSFNDNNIAPDFSITPPIYDPVFTGAGDYPGAVAYFDQRRCFGGTDNQPQEMWMSKTGTETDFTYSLPVKDTDRIMFRVATREANTVRHIVPMAQLLLLTSSTEMRVSPVNSDALTPSDVSVRPQSYVGASQVQPSIINNSLVYCAARGGHVREMGYAWTSNGWVTGDLSLRAKHLFDNLTIVDQAYSKSPTPIVWFISSNGTLLGLTYIPEEQIGAWHEHSTDGVFESIACVAEGNDDRLYAVIRRTVNGSTVRYIERMASRIIDGADPSTWFFVDAGATYNGAPTTGVTGLTWLEGKTVSILADGAVQPQQVVTGGAITLGQAASVIQIGIPYTSDIQTLPLVMQMDGLGQGRQKNINKVWIRANYSSSIFAGPDFDHLIEYKQRTTEPYGAPPALVSNELEIVTTPSWQYDGQLCVRQSDPLPVSVVSLTMEVAIGG